MLLRNDLCSVLIIILFIIHGIGEHICTCVYSILCILIVTCRSTIVQAETIDTRKLKL